MHNGALYNQVVTRVPLGGRSKRLYSTSRWLPPLHLHHTITRRELAYPIVLITQVTTASTLAATRIQLRRCKRPGQDQDSRTESAILLASAPALRSQDNIRSVPEGCPGNSLRGLRRNENNDREEQELPWDRCKGLHCRSIARSAPLLERQRHVG